MIKGIQLFIHRYYNAIKLLMQFITIGLLLFLIQYAVSLSAQGAEARRDLIIEITQSIQKETRKQTDTLNKQLEALCLVVIQTAGKDALDTLDPEIRNKCTSLADEPTGTQATPSSTPRQPEGQQSPPSSSSTEKTQDPGASGGNGGNDNPQPKSPLLQVIDNTVSGTTSVVDGALKALGL